METAAEPVAARFRPSGGRGAGRPFPLNVAVRLGERMLDRLEDLPRPWDIVRTQLALIRAARDVESRETGQLLSLLEGPSAEARAPAGAEDPAEDPAVSRSVDESGGGAELAEARLIGDAVRFVAEAGLVRTRCLARALAAKRLMDDRGLEDARIRVGVREAGGELLAHAWVEFRGHVVGDFPERVERYTDLRGLQVHSGDGGGASRREPERR